MILKDAPCSDFDIGGDCLARFQDSVSENLSYLEEWVQPDPILMAQMALEKYDTQGESEEEVKPLYLRGADISKPKTPPRKLAQS